MKTASAILWGGAGGDEPGDHVHQLPQSLVVNRLAEVGEDAQIVGAAAVLRLDGRGDDHDRRLAQLGLLAHPLEDFEAGEAGDQEIEEDQRRRRVALVGEEENGLLPVGDHMEGVGDPELGERPFQKEDLVAVVFDHEDQTVGVSGLFRHYQIESRGGRALRERSSGAPRCGIGFQEGEQFVQLSAHVVLDGEFRARGEFQEDDEGPKGGFGFPPPGVLRGPAEGRRHVMGAAAKRLVPAAGDQFFDRRFQREQGLGKSRDEVDEVVSHVSPLSN